MKRGWIAAGLVGVAVGLAQAEPPRYRVEVLQDLAPVGPGEYQGKGITSFGAGGDAIGWAASGGGDFSPVRWNGSVPTALPLPAGWTSGYALGQDGMGRIAGTAYMDGHFTEPRAIAWREGEVHFLPGPAGGNSYVSAMNPSGTIAGAVFESGGPSRAVTWSNGGAGAGYTEFPALPGHDSAIATDINEAGAVAGLSYTLDDWVVTTRPVIWREGSSAELPIPVGAERGGAVKINARGDAIGWWDDEETIGILHAALWRDGKLVDDPAISTPNLQLYGLNDAGQASGTLLEEEWSGVMYENGVLYRLTDWVEGGWIITQAEVIAGDGRIYAIGMRGNDYADVVLVPIPAPASIVLLGLALSAGFRRRP